MTELGRSEGPAGDACPICQKTLDELGRCSGCGAAFGEADRCPHCRVIAGVEPSALLRYRCRVCGGPRIPIDAPEDSPPRAELDALRRARGEQLRSDAFRAGAWLLAATGALALLLSTVVLLATHPGALAAVAALLISGAPLAVGIYAQRRARRHARERDRALGQAWLAAAAQAARSDPACNAARLSQRLRIQEADAELLIAELSVQDLALAPELANTAAASKGRTP